MRSFIAFRKKEWMEQKRLSKLLILGIVFVLFGIMNPAIAKLTPWLFEIMSESLEESGMIIATVEVDAMDSWVQFFKNIPMVLIIFVLIESGIFTKEYQTGTLILALTKGLHRKSVIFAKTTMLITLWTVGYWITFGITYVYNDYFWANSIVDNLLCSVMLWWIFGLWIIALMVLFSTIATANTGVLAGTGGVAVACYLFGLLPKLSNYMPTLLMDGNSLIYGVKDAKDYKIAVFVSVITCIICFAVSIPMLNKKRI